MCFCVYFCPLERDGTKGRSVIRARLRAFLHLRAWLKYASCTTRYVSLLEESDLWSATLLVLEDPGRFRGEEMHRQVDLTWSKAHFPA